MSKQIDDSVIPDGIARDEEVAGLLTPTPQWMNESYEITTEDSGKIFMGMPDGATEEKTLTDDADGWSTFFESRTATTNYKGMVKIPSPTESFLELSVRGELSVREVGHTRCIGTDGFGSGNTKIIRWGSADYDDTVDVTYNADSTDGDHFLIETNGLYRVSITYYNDDTNPTILNIRYATELENTTVGNEESIKAAVTVPGESIGSLCTEIYGYIGDKVWITSSNPVVDSLQEFFYQITVSGAWRHGD